MVQLILTGASSRPGKPVIGQAVGGPEGTRVHAGRSNQECPASLAEELLEYQTDQRAKQRSHQHGGVYSQQIPKHQCSLAIQELAAGRLDEWKPARPDR